MASRFDTTTGRVTAGPLEDNLNEMRWSLTPLFHRWRTHIQKLPLDNAIEVPGFGHGLISICFKKGSYFINLSGKSVARYNAPVSNSRLNGRFIL